MQEDTASPTGKFSCRCMLKFQAHAGSMHVTQGVTRVCSGGLT